MIIERKDYVTIFKFDVSYASEDKDFREIPVGYIDKTVCGCGLTTVAIQQPYDTIIAVSNVALVDNKVAQYANNPDIHLLGVKEGVTEKDVDNYVQRVRNEGRKIKIITTYDSLRKCDKWLSDCRFVIDECQMLAEYSVLKCKNTEMGEKDCITYLMETAEKNKERVSFISATPLPAEEMKPYNTWLTQLPQIRMEWPEEKKQRNMTLVYSKTPIDSAVEMIIRPLKKKNCATLGKHTFTKAIIFVNSVKGIESMINSAKLTPEETVYLCSDTLENSFKLKDYERLTDYENLPRFTFITSTGFQGIDLYDPEAITVVISTAIDVSIAFKMIDLNIDLKQCLSRQRRRDNPHYNDGILFYSTSDFKGMSAQHFIDETNDLLYQITDNCTLLNEEWHKIDNPIGNYKDWATLNPQTRFAALLAAFSLSPIIKSYSHYYWNSEEFTINTFPFYVTQWLITNKMKCYDGTIPLRETLESQGYLVVEVEDTYVKPQWNTILTKLLTLHNNPQANVTFSNAELNSDYYKIGCDCIRLFNKIPKKFVEAKAKSRNAQTWEEIIRESRNLIMVEGVYEKAELKAILDQLLQPIHRKAKSIKPILSQLGFKANTDYGIDNDKVKILSANDVDINGHILPPRADRHSGIVMMAIASKIKRLLQD